MNMKVYIYLILICLNVFCRLNAQTRIAGNEQYNSYELCIYVDNLSQKSIPDIFVSTYYDKLKTSDFKKAKDGFLFVNKYIMDHVTNLNCELGKMKVLYIYNNKEVKTKEDVMSVLRLRKKSIQISEITQDEQSGLITVYVIDQ